MQRIHGEVDGLPIGARGKGVSQDDWSESLLHNIIDGVEIIEVLRHLAAFYEQVSAMYPVAKESGAAAAFALSDLIFMMREYEVLATGMDIEVVP